MGQFYKTSKPQFVEDFMYQPPWELAKEAILAKDKRVNQEIAVAGELGKVLNFEALDFDKDAADSKKMLYKGKIDSLVDKIKKDPMNYSKYGSELTELKNEMSEDFSKGEVADIMGTYAGAQKFNKDHDKYKVKEGARFNAGYGAFYNEAKKSREELGRSNGSKGVWNSEQLMGSMDIGKGFLQHLGKLKGNSAISATEGTDGRYIYKNKSSNEVLSKQRVEQLMKDYVETLPNAKEYQAQTMRIGMGNPLEGLMELAGNYAYSKTSSEQGLKTNAYGTQAQGFANSKALVDYRQQVKDKAEGNTLKGSGGGYVETAPLNMLVGDVMAQNLFDHRRKIGSPITRDTPVTFGTGDLRAQGILNEKSAKDMDAKLAKFKDVSSFGDMTLAFIPQKTIKIGTHTFHAGRTYVKTAAQAKREGLIQDYIPNSAQPYYQDDKVNGVNLKFTYKSKDPKSVVQPDMIRANIVPTGSMPGIVNGGSIFFTK